MERSDIGSHPGEPVSVIIVNYNAGELLLQCLHSVFSSSVRVEVILCDNASADGSTERANSSLSQAPAHPESRQPRFCQGRQRGAGTGNG